MIESKAKAYNFLEGGGEMGRLVRNHDWSGSPLGPVDRWPQSLRTLVDVILHSDTPMLIWWGEELIQLYNDAFRPSLGEHGKHPRALGQRGDECWPEIWPIIKPFIDRVHAGGSVWKKDQLIPIFRNGAIEDVYWTFGYSPVRDESGTISGVLVICNETTAQVKATKRLEVSERTLRSIVEVAPVGICIVQDEDLRPELVNDVILEMTGKTKQEFLSASLWQLFPELKSLYEPFLNSVMRTGEAYRGHELKLVFDRGATRSAVYLDIVIKPLKVGSDHLGDKLMIIAIDVTDKVLARQKVEESEERYRTMITESTVAIAVYTGPDFRVQYVNQIMTGYWGKDISVVGKPLAEALPEIIGQPFLGQLAQVYATGEPFVGTEKEATLRVSGRLQPSYFNYVFKPLKDSKGRVYGIYHLALDVTEQVVSRKKREQNEATLRNIIRKAPVAMCILQGSNFVVEIANDMMFRLWGRPREEMIRRPIFEALPEVRHQGFEEILTNVFKTGQSFNAEAIPIKLPRDGSTETVYVNFLYEAYRDAEDSVSGVLAVATDVTEQVRARQRVEELVAERTKALAESNKNLQRSNDELAQFAYIASHDLQEPARKITTFTEMLQSSLVNPDARAKMLLDKIESSSTRMLSLVRDILAYSQLSKERQGMSKVDLNEVLRNTLEDFELRIAEKKAVVEASPLPVIDGIPVQISQLFGNLISNALKFSSKLRTPRIVITAEEPGEEELRDHSELKPGLSYCKISFSDNGIGFSQRNARQIFDIFQRLHGRTEYEGTGIGLAMCKKIAQNHNGDIVAESVEGEGSTFHVFLPSRYSK